MLKIFLNRVIISLCILTGCKEINVKEKNSGMDINKKNNLYYSLNDSNKLEIGNNEWKKILPEDVYKIAREKGTEKPFSGKYWDYHEIGTYYCAACGNALFASNGKFQSNCGWPSFFEPVSKGSIIYAPDNSYGMKRTEVICGRCKGHLGHVFEDGPPPTGLRYCINSVILDFKKAEKIKKQ